MAETIQLVTISTTTAIPNAVYVVAKDQSGTNQAYTTTTASFISNLGLATKSYVDNHHDSEKVDKENGKSLSTNDFTNAYKGKLDGIATGAEVNVQSDWGQTNNTKDDYIKNKPLIKAGTGYASVIEGSDGSASGSNAHAEGNNCVAEGNASHAEGYCTIAKGSSQHAAGRYNVADSYALRITGNGDNDTNRANIEKLTWFGDLRLRRDVYVNCNSDSSGGVKLQKELIAGDGIVINADGRTISATGGGGGTTAWGSIGGTLSNQTDLTEIVSSNNLFNNADTDIKPNIYINGSGSEVSNANYITTGYIPVTALSYYKWWSSQSGASVFTSKSVRVASYGEDKTFISATSSSDADNGYQAVSGAKYIRISYTRAFPDNLMCCIATYTPTTYEAYFSKTIIKKTLVYADDSVNSTSTNPIQNKAIKEYIDIKPYLNPHGCNLPDTIYAFANYEIDLHLRNIYNYEDGDALTRARVTVSGGGNYGKLDSKKLSYTPTSAGTKLAQIYNFDHNYNALNRDVKTISVVNASTKSSLKTLVIGDSFVNGGKMTLQMLENAEEDNYDLTLLGTRGSSTNQHEGRGGWTAQMYCTQASVGSTSNAFYNPSLTTTSKFDFSYYMTNQGYSGVDCVFINLGTNDLFTTRTDTERTNAINTWLANLDNMVNSIHSYDSNIKIVINPPILSSRDEDTWGEIYAAANPPVHQVPWLFSRATHEGGIKAREHYANASNVYVGWTNASIDTANMVGDVHPTEAGYRQLGNAMYSIMRAIN